MLGTTKLPNLIEEIYDAALEPALWNNVVASINDFVGGQACGVISKDTMSQSGLTYYYCGVDPHTSSFIRTPTPDTITSRSCRPSGRS